jgi:hypothetical protein
MPRATHFPATHLPTTRARITRLALLALAACATVAPASASAFELPFLNFKTVTTIASTVPANGDLNPYGIANVQSSIGSLVAGDVLVSNFNDAANLQGTGTTIVQVSPSGHQSLFAELHANRLPGACPGGVGLTTALSILPNGYVVVGSLPTTDGSAATAQAGCLIVLNSQGKAVETISGPPIDGPWDMTAVADGENATLLVSNVLNRTVAAAGATVDGGTVVRIRLHVSDHHVPQVTQMSVIATGFSERTDPAALVVGPTGLALGNDGTLYVADTQGNRVAAVPNALSRVSALTGAGETVATGGYLNGPLGLSTAPNGDVLAANANDGDIVEVTPAGAEFQPLDTGAGGGGLFGLTIAPNHKGVLMVNDSSNELDLLH